MRRLGVGPYLVREPYPLYPDDSGPAYAALTFAVAASADIG